MSAHTPTDHNNNRHFQSTVSTTRGLIGQRVVSRAPTGRRRAIARALSRCTTGRRASQSATRYRTAPWSRVPVSGDVCAETAGTQTHNLTGNREAARHLGGRRGDAGGGGGGGGGGGTRAGGGLEW